VQISDELLRRMLWCHTSTESHLCRVNWVKVHRKNKTKRRVEDRVGGEWRRVRETVSSKWNVEHSAEPERDRRECRKRCERVRITSTRKSSEARGAWSTGGIKNCQEHGRR
jgi:hypothetical protein